MKKLYTLLSVFILIFLLSGTANAEASQARIDKINEIKQKIVDVKQKAAENRERIKAANASSTPKLKQELKNAAEIRIGKKLDEKKIKVADVFEKSIQNLKDLILRTESRISKIEAENINVSSSKKLLETTKTKLALAETELASLENLLVIDLSTTTVSSSDRKTALNKIKLQSEKTKSAIKTTHKSIVDVISSLKTGLLKKVSTSTPQEISTTTNN